MVKIDARTKEELWAMAESIAKGVQFYDKEYRTLGDWGAFFDKSNPDFSNPHIALFETFLRLFGHSQEHINTLTQKHLDYYYKEVLKVKEKEANADSIDLVFELAKNISTYILPKGTVVDAGKDIFGNPLTFTTDRELVLNKVQISKVRQSHLEHQPFSQTVDNEIFAIYKAKIGDSKDELDALATESSAWRAMGDIQNDLASNQQSMDVAEVGFAVSSPILLMREGNRRIDLTLTFANIPASLTALVWSSFLKFELSSTGAWLTPSFSIQNITSTQLQVRLTIPETSPAVVTFGESKLDGNFNSSFAVMKCMMKCEGDYSDYKSLAGLELLGANARVVVNGLKSLILQNGQSSISTDQSFYPFGTIPAIGSKVMIGCPEAFNKKLDKFSINFEWQDKPENFDSHYSGYGSTAVNPSDFTIGIRVLNERKWHKQTGANAGDYRLFPSGTDTIDVTLNNINGLYQNEKSPLEFDRYNVNLNRGFISLELRGPRSGRIKGFGHLDYSKVFTEAIMKRNTFQTMLQAGKLEIDSATAHSSTISPSAVGRQWQMPVSLQLDAVRQKFDHLDGVLYKTLMPTLPKEPYTPLADGVSINYECSQNFTFTHGTEEGIYQITPFGQFAITDFGSTGEGIKWAESHEDDGYLYLGLSDVEAPQTVSICFQMKEGSESSELSIEDDDTSWAYLDGNKWLEFNDLEIESDTTSQLQTSGIMSIKIPKIRKASNWLDDPSLFWLRFACKKDESATMFGKIISVRTQAVTATYSLSASTATHLGSPLAAGTAKKVLGVGGNIKSVSQLYESYNGQGLESSSELYIRTHERLRHKNRAIALWDYERMVLDAFPWSFKVKCLNTTEDYSGISPRNVTLAIIPDNKNRVGENPLQPKVGGYKLQSVKEYISKHTSPFVKIKAVNPHYQEILVKCKVEFNKGYDERLYSGILNEDLKKFLSPWAYEEGKDIAFGGKIFKSSILHFMEQQPYVNHIFEFTLHSRYESWGIGCMEVDFDFVVGGIYTSDDSEIIWAVTPLTVLASASEHEIGIVQPGKYQC